MANRRINFSDNERVTAIIAEEITPAVWVAFAQNNDGEVTLQKASAFQPDQIYFTITREVDNIKAMTSSSSNIYAIYEDDVEFAELFSITNPHSDFTGITFPVGVIESPVDIFCDDTYVWILTPGSTSGQTAKLIRYNLTLSSHTVIDLDTSGNEVTDAISLTVDDDGDVWIVTHTDPSTFVRVFELSGGGFDYEVNTTI